MHSTIPALLIVSILATAPAAQRAGQENARTAADVAARFSWGDYDADGLADVLTVTATGELRLLRNGGDGSFDDVTLDVGLDGVRAAGFGLWGDYDGDGRVDLFVGTEVGPSHLFRNRGEGLFEDVAATSGLTVEAVDRSAEWLDYDADGRLDLHVVTTGGDLIYHALGDEIFERVELDLPQLLVPDAFGAFGGPVPARTRPAEEEGIDPTVRAPRPRSTSRSSSRAPLDVSFLALDDRALPTDGGAPGGSIGFSVSTVPLAPFGCAPSLVDQATGECLNASSSATSGALFPYPGIDNVFAAPAFVGGGEINSATGRHATIGGGYSNVAATAFAAVGGGRFNTASGAHSVIGGGWQNTAQGNLSVIGGGFDNETVAQRSTIGGGHRNRTSGKHSTIGGGRDNFTGDELATIGGGNNNDAIGVGATVGGGLANFASGVAATVGGGRFNTASGENATIGGGDQNEASGENATVGGGDKSTASGENATVGGGDRNTASGEAAAVAGGMVNVASGDRAMVPGGAANTAQGKYSFAAGRLAKANHRGAFVWGDGESGFAKPSSADNEFSVYCQGGARFFSDGGAATAGVTLAPGAGSWSSVSDRASKENVEPVDGRAVLERLSEIPMATWNYRAQDDSIRHMGPMAQDFHAAFGLGASEKAIDTIDADGVALAAIQGLRDLVKERDAEIAELRARLERLEARIAVK